MKQSMILLVAFLTISFTAAAQKDVKAAQKQQEKTIKAAYKSKKVTENEYNKLMDEQEVIKNTIEKYEADGELDDHEKGVIHDKLDRAANRLRRYKTNGERY